MPKNTDQRKFRNRASDARRFSTPSDNVCRGCEKNTRGSCCFKVDTLGTNTEKCPKGKRCWECVDSATECECAQLGGDFNCLSANGRWRFNSAALECSDCPCHTTSEDLQVVTPGCSYNPGTPGADYPCCMDVWSKNLDLRDLTKKETELYTPYNILQMKIENCRCGCKKSSGELYCSESNENQLNAIKSHAGGVSPVQVKFFRSNSYDEISHTIYDKYRQRFRRLFYAERENNIQHVKWDFVMKRYAADARDNKTGGENRNGSRGIHKNIRFDATDLILRFKYAPGAEIPMNPRDVDGELMYTPSQWSEMKRGVENDVPQDLHVIDIPFPATANQGLGNITIPVLGNYKGNRKVLRFDIEILDATTKNVLSSFDRKTYNKSDARNSHNYQTFSGYQDCYYSGTSCYSYETAWDSVFIVLEG